MLRRVRTKNPNVSYNSSAVFLFLSQVKAAVAAVQVVVGVVIRRNLKKSTKWVGS